MQRHVELAACTGENKLQINELNALIGACHWPRKQKGSRVASHSSSSAIGAASRSDPPSSDGI